MSRSKELLSAIEEFGSIRQLAKKTGFSKTTLIHWRDGVNVPTDASWARFQESLDRARHGEAPMKRVVPRASLTRSAGLVGEDADSIARLLRSLTKKRGVRQLDVQQQLEEVRGFAKSDPKEFAVSLYTYFQVYLETRTSE